MYDLAQLFKNQLFQDVATKLAIKTYSNSFNSLSQVASYALIISYIFIFMYNNLIKVLSFVKICEVYISQ